ncbi:MAG TPA: hypothetical protein VF546_24150 [Pyrinomonadaceae bacterium]|jgi:hypothetical protein
MALPDLRVHSFIVKLWLDEAEGTTDPDRLHGHITHVPSGERRYLKDIDGIPDFVMYHLKLVGVTFSGRWRVKHCLRCWRRFLRGM